MVVVGSNGISIGILNLTRYWFKPAVFIGLLVRRMYSTRDRRNLKLGKTSFADSVMSALGTKRTCIRRRLMSAFGVRALYRYQQWPFRQTRLRG
jgi:DNA-directed RNA polymerase subunit N (RpoN/RPB10)